MKEIAFNDTWGQKVHGMYVELEEARNESLMLERQRESATSTTSGNDMSALTAIGEMSTVHSIFHTCQVSILRGGPNLSPRASPYPLF